MSQLSLGKETLTQQNLDHDKLLRNIQDNTHQLTSMHEQYKSQLQQSQELNHEINSKTSELRDCEKKLQLFSVLYGKEERKYEEIKRICTEQMKVTQSDVAVLQTHLKNKKKKLSEMVLKEKEVRNEYERNETLLNEMKIRIQRETETHEREVSQLQEICEERRNEILTLKEEKKRYEREIRGIMEKKSKEVHGYQKEVDDLKKDVSDLRKDLEGRERESKRVREDLLLLEGNKNSLIKDIQRLHTQQQDMIQNENKIKENYLEEIQKVQKELEKISFEKGELLNENQKLIFEHKEISRKIRESTNQSNELMETFQRTEEMIRRQQLKLHEITHDEKRSSKDIQDLRTEKSELLLQIQQLKLNKNYYEKENTKYLEEYHEFEERELRLRSDEEKLSEEFNSLQKEYNSLKKDLKEMKKMSENDKKQILELKTEKNHLENSKKRYEEEIQSLTQQHSYEEKKLHEITLSTQHLTDQYLQLQQEMNILQRRKEQLLTEEANYELKNHHRKEIIQKINHEKDEIIGMISAEKNSLENLLNRKEFCVNEIKNLNVELEKVRNENQKQKQLLESNSLTHSHFLTLKKELENSLEKLQEKERHEERRLQQLQESCEDMIQKYSDVQKKIEMEEKTLYKIRLENKEQEQRLVEKNHKLYQTTENILNMKTLISDVEMTLSSQRELAIEEISKLNEAKHSVTHHMLLLSDGHQRAERMGYRSPSSATAPVHLDEENGENQVRKRRSHSSVTAAFQRSSPSSLGYHREDPLENIVQHQRASSSLTSALAAVTTLAEPSSRETSGHGFTGREKIIPSNHRPTNQAGRERSESHRPDSGGDTAFGIQDEISDLRAEMLKLSAQSAAVLKSAIDSHNT
jgi:chromosome segregation ATPase